MTINRSPRFAIRLATPGMPPIRRDVSKASAVEFQQVGDTIRREKFLQKKGKLRYKPGQEELPTLILEPRGETRRTVIWLDPAGKSGSSPPMVLPSL